MITDSHRKFAAMVAARSDRRRIVLGPTVRRFDAWGVLVVFSSVTGPLHGFAQLSRTREAAEASVPGLVEAFRTEFRDVQRFATDIGLASAADSPEVAELRADYAEKNLIHTPPPGETGILS